jgi:hypothetical protein
MAMSTPGVTIQGTPVLVNVSYVPLNGTPPPSAHLLGYGSGGLLEAVLSLPLEVQTLLGTPLDQLFQNDWSALQNTAQNQVRQALQASSSHIYNVGPVAIPQQGTLQAYTYGINPFWENWGHSGSALVLSYSLPGWSVSFKYSTGNILPDPGYTVSFDGEVGVLIGVPTDPSVPLYISAGFDATNFQVSGANLWAGVYAFVNALASAFGISLFTAPSLPSVEGAAIPLPGAFANLSTAFVKAADFGFTQLDVAVITNPPPGPPAGNTVQFELTHPADPGPQVSNALAPSVPRFTSAQIWVDQPQVAAGQSDQVYANSFPPAQASQLQIKWTNTTSGLLDHSEVKYGPTTAPGIPPTEITDSTTPGNTFTATPLTPGTWYGFLAREFDAQGFISTGWSVPAVPSPPEPQPWDGIWTYLQTQATNQVNLVLYDVNGTLVAPVGTANLQPDGTFSEPSYITVPEPPTVTPSTTYDLVAILAGQKMASCSITILSQGQTLPPLLEVINPNNGNMPYPGPAVVVVGSPVYLTGKNFPNGGTVSLWVDAIGGTSLGTATAQANGIFTASPLWPAGVIGAHDVLAEASTPATAPVYAESPAQ